jgi:SAM-dependent methyltransferase
MTSDTNNVPAVEGPQNIYDTAEFFNEYIKLDRQVNGLDGAPEWPRLRMMLPEMKGGRVLDLGCGMGWFARWAQENGAVYVLGLEISLNMLQKARDMTQVDGIEYQRGDLDQLNLPGNEYDLIFSSLAFHYLTDIQKLFQQIHHALKPGGKIVFSIEHPIFTGPTRGGLISDAEGRKIWPLDAYQREGPRLRNWFVDGVIKQHHTLGTYINALLRFDLELTDFVEWCPTDEDLQKFPKWETEFIRPTFLLMGASKRRS